MSLLVCLLAMLLTLLVSLDVTGPGGITAAARSGASSEPPTPLTVTTVDNGRTLTLAVGDEILLALGDGAWTVRLSDPAFLAWVPNVAMVRGAQGIYVARRTGRATLSASALGGARFRIVVVVK